MIRNVLRVCAIVKTSVRLYELRAEFSNFTVHYLKMSRFRREQTLSEEKANYITHALGIAFSIVAIPYMIVYAVQKSSASTIWGVSIFGFAMLMVYLASTIYHAVKQNTETKR